MSDAYWKKLKDPRWQKKRLEVMEKAEFTCKTCSAKDKTLTVHHINYRKGAEPWDYEDDELACLCEDCHEAIEKKVIPELRELATRIPPEKLMEIAACLKRAEQICKVTGETNPAVRLLFYAHRTSQAAAVAQHLLAIQEKGGPMLKFGELAVNVEVML